MPASDLANASHGCKASLLIHGLVPLCIQYSFMILFAGYHRYTLLDQLVGFCGQKSKTHSFSSIADPLEIVILFSDHIFHLD